MEKQNRINNNQSGGQFAESTYTGPDEFGSQRMKGDEAIVDLSREVSSWEGVTIHTHSMGGIEFRFRGSELGHLHDPAGETATADLEFPLEIRNQLVDSGKAYPHITGKRNETGWITVPMGTVSEIANAIVLFEKKYLYLIEKFQKAGHPAHEPG